MTKPVPTLKKPRKQHAPECRQEALELTKRTSVAAVARSIACMNHSAMPGITVTSAASVRRPSNRPRCEDRICLRAWGQSNHCGTEAKLEPWACRGSVPSVCLVHRTR